MDLLLMAFPRLMCKYFLIQHSARISILSCEILKLCLIYYCIPLREEGREWLIYLLFGWSVLHHESVLLNSLKFNISQL